MWPFLLRGTLLTWCALALPSCVTRSQNYFSRATDANWTGAKIPQAASALTASTALSVVNNPISSTHQGISSIRERGSELLKSFIPFGTSAPDVIAGDIEASLDRAGLPRPVPGKVKPLIDGRRFFPRMEESIRKAQHRVDVQIFIFENDDYGVTFADLLKEKSYQVRPRVLVDALGTTAAGWSPPKTKPPAGFQSPSSIVRYLREDSRVQVRKIWNPWLTFDHTKLLVTDRHAYIGGMNIGRKYLSECHDMMVELEGPVVESLHKQFLKRWAMAAPLGDVALLRSWRVGKTEPLPEAFPIRILRTAPSRHEIEDALLIAIRASERRIVIETPYLSSDSITDALLEAHKRGVKVSVIFPRENDSAVMASNNRNVAVKLARAGLGVYQLNGFSHLKAALVDGWVCVGAANLDLLSLRINRELNISFSDPQAVRRFEKELFDHDLRRARKLSLRNAEKQVKAMDPAGEVIADQL